ncbi:MAG TPA: SprB repeat-containing protein, partial [Chryseosolibacter sp.]
DGSIAAAASGGTGNSYTYKWSTGETTADLIGLGAGTYTVIASDTNECAGVAETVLMDPALLEVFITIKSDYYGQAISCVGASDAMISGSVKGGTPPLSYAWNSIPSPQELVNIPAGQYIFTAKDENNCTGVAEITISDPQPVEAKIARVSDYHGYGVSCYGENDGYILAEGSGGTQIYDYLWHETDTSDPLNANLESGRYTVTVSDENGCSDTETWEISEPERLTLGIADTKHVSCNEGDDGAIQLAALGGAQGYEYAISGEAWQSLPSLQELKAGIYEFIARDSNGCSAIARETVMEPAPLQISFTNIVAALCGDPRGKVSASAEGGTGEYRYLWMDAQKSIIGKEPDISELPAGIFFLTVTDEHFCALTEAVGITSTDGPTVQVSKIIPSTCSYTADGRAMLEVTNGTAPYSFLWSNGQTTSEASNLAKGEYWVQVKDSNDCIAVEALSIQAPDALEMQLLEKKSPTCHGDCDGKILVAAKGGNGNYTYAWENFTGPSLEGICAGQYEVTVVDQKQCVAVKTIVLEQPGLLRSRLLSAQSPTGPGGCDGKIDIEGSGGTGILNYAWSNGTTSYALQNACAGDHTATITDQNNCTITATFSLDEAKVRSIDLGGAITLCAGQTHLLDAGPNWQSYSWKGSSGFTSSERLITISEAGMYSLEARTLKGCTVRDTFLLQTSSDLLKANFLMATQALAGDTIVMIDISWPLPEHIQWDFPEELILLNNAGDIAFGQFENPGSYQVALTTTLGACRDVLSKTITISDGGEN